MLKRRRPVYFDNLLCALKNGYSKDAIQLILKNINMEKINTISCEALQLAIEAYLKSSGLGNTAWKNLISQGLWSESRSDVPDEVREIMDLIPKPCLNLSYIPNDILKIMIDKCVDIRKFELRSAIGHVSEDILNQLLERGVKMSPSDMITVLEYGYSEEFVLKLNNLFTEMYDEGVHTIEMAHLRNYSPEVIKAIESKYPPKSSCITM
jgi:hypothetical protein